VDDSALPALLEREHRALDELFGRFLGAIHGGTLEDAREAIAAFDEELSRHTAFEEERAIAAPAGRKLAPGVNEDASERLARELRLEHVQVRELSAMVRRLLDEKGDLEGARRLAPNLARRWDAHTSREEKELFPTLGA